jgi:hypothetical protein
MQWTSTGSRYPPVNDVLSTERKDTFDQILRDFRNFIHPEKETRSKYACGEGEAEMAKSALDALHDLWA